MKLRHSLVSIHKKHILAPAGVLALCKSSAESNYACGYQIVAALPGTKIYYIWMDTH